MIWMKFILAVMLTAIPFAYHIYIAPRKEKSSTWRNMFAFLFAKIPQVKLFFNMVIEILRKFHQGMKKYDSFRKFFILLVLLVMLVCQFVDFSVSNKMAKNAISTCPLATIMAALISLVFFSYRLADMILLMLHTERKAFVIFGFSLIVLLFASPQSFILVETLFTVLMASYFYPMKDDCSPQNRETTFIGQGMSVVA